MKFNNDEINIIKEVEIGTNNNIPQKDLTVNDIIICPIDDHQTMGLSTITNLLSIINEINDNN